MTLLNRMLALTSVALGALLVSQLAFGVRLMLPWEEWNKPPVVRLHASWINNANTAAEGKAQSDHIVLGEVIGLAKGPDIVHAAPEEPEGQVSIPTTIVRLAVKKTYKGAPGEVVELFQTGGGTDAVQLPAPPEADAAKPPKAQKGRGNPPGPTSNESRATILEDDPPYQIGEKYILFLKNIDEGPGVAAAGALAALPPGMVRALAPEGRYQITKQDHLKPVTTKKGFAPQWQGRHMSELEAEISTP